MLRQIALKIGCVVALAACLPQAKRPVAADQRPFDVAPTAQLVDQHQAGPSYRVQIAADITRDVMPTDDLAIVVRVGDEEVGRYPVVGRFTQRPTRIKQEIELPLGDYELALVYKGEGFVGTPFRVAVVPVWGGRRVVQLRSHPGTRISLREQKLWVGRWWANDSVPQAWIVEWVRDGQVRTTTSGREDHGVTPEAAHVVGGAAGAYHATQIVNHTIWAYGEEYAVPTLVAQEPGAWAARVVHGSSPPLAVVFHVATGGRLIELSPQRVEATKWEPSWSRPLAARALTITEVDRLSAKLPKLSASEPFDDIDTRATLDAPLRLSLEAMRALFRSQPLAEAWNAYIALNVPAQYTQLYPGQPPAIAAKRNGVATPTRESPAKDRERRARLKSLRTQIEQLIRENGSPWKPEEFPRS